MEKLLTAQQVSDLVPGMSPGLLKTLRHLSQGPKYLKPSPRRVVYRESDVIAWLNASERTGTRDR